MKTPTKTEILEALDNCESALKDTSGLISIEAAADIFDKLINPVDPRAVTKDTPEDALVDWVNGNGEACTNRARNLHLERGMKLHVCFENFPHLGGKTQFQDNDYPLNVKFRSGRVDTFYLGAKDRAEEKHTGKGNDIIACYPSHWENE